MLPGQPPATIDNATVVLWAWSWPEPFFRLPVVDEDGQADHIASVAIHGLAIARYASGSIYRFSCDAAWETQSDTDFETIDDARDTPSAQYDVTRVEWRAWTT